MADIYFEYDRSGKFSRIENVRPKGLEGYNVWSKEEEGEAEFLEFATLDDFHDLVKKYQDKGHDIYMVREKP